MKHLSLALIARVCVIAFLAFVLAQETLAIFQIRGEAAELSLEAARRSGTDSQARALRAIRVSSSQDLESINKAAVTKSRLADVVSEIEASGKSLGLALSISSISASAQAASTSPSTVRIAVETLGSWSGSIGFVHLIENLPYRISIEESKLALTDKGWKGNNTFSITILPE